MTILRAITFIGLLCVNFSFTASADEYQNLLNEWCNEHQLTSAVLSIANLKTGKIDDYTSGNIGLGSAPPVTSNSLYGVGSITKSFIAAIVLQLQQQGKLNIDEPIGNYFPEYPRWKNITIRELLNMTSGITNYLQLPLYQKLITQDKSKAVNPKIFIDSAYAAPDQFAPGKSWGYSNTNYLLLGEIIEKVTHQSVQRVLQNQLFKPIGLSHTYYSDTFYPKSVTSQMAHAYYDNQDVTDFNASLPSSAGAMLMNSHDLIKWVDALFVSNEVLSQQGIKELTTTVKEWTLTGPDNQKIQSYYGLGVRSINTKCGAIWYYAGAIIGYTSAFMWLPQEDKIIAVQAASWPGTDDLILMPNRPFMQKLLQMNNC